jgi:uncharacterized protein HemX/uroporphyrinogen-III synthase
MTVGGSPPSPPDGERDGLSLPDVVLTQATESGESLAHALGAAGFRVLRWPLVRLSPKPLAQMRPVLERLEDYDWVLLPSPSAVRLVARQMAELGIAWPARVRAGLVGPSSVEAFRACFGTEPAVDAPDGPPHDAARLVAAVAQRGRVGRALVLNRPDGRLHWLDALRGACESVEVVPAYEAEPLPEPPAPALVADLEAAHDAGRAVAWVAGAASQVDLLVRCMPSHLSAWLLEQPLHVPHPALRDHATALGFRRVSVYDDRGSLMLRLQYPGPTDIASPASVADNKEGPLLSSDEQKDPAHPGATRGSEATTASAASAASSASPVSPESPVSPVSPVSPSSTPSPATSGTGAAAAASTTPAPATTPPASSKPASAVESPRPPFSSPAPRMPDPPAPRAFPPEPPPPAAAPAASAGRAGRLWGPALLLLLIALAIAGWWYTQQRFLEAEREGARRLQEAESRAAKLDEQLRGLRDAQNQMQARSKALEAKLAESSTQQEQLATLYEEIARARGDNALVEAEQSVQTASQHLELTGNVRGAILALEAADRRLADSDQAAAVGARRLVLADIERLKALPEIDLSRLAARLDEVIARVDRLPLLADANQQFPAASPSAAQPSPATAPSSASGASGASAAPAQAGAGTAASPAPGTTASDPASAATGQPSAGAATAGDSAPAAPTDSFLERLWARVVSGASSGLQALREEFRSVVTIRRVDQPDNLLLSPEQKRLARDNLKLLLLNARLDLINRHEALFRKDIERVTQSMQGLFDMDSHEVKAAIATLQSLQSQPLAAELPSLSESLTAVKAARAASEKRS